MINPVRLAKRYIRALARGDETAASMVCFVFLLLAGLFDRARTMVEEEAKRRDEKARPINVFVTPCKATLVINRFFLQKKKNCRIAFMNSPYLKKDTM